MGMGQIVAPDYLNLTWRSKRCLTNDEPQLGSGANSVARASEPPDDPPRPAMCSAGFGPKRLIKVGTDLRAVRSVSPACPVTIQRFRRNRPTLLSEGDARVPLRVVGTRAQAGRRSVRRSAFAAGAGTHPPTWGPTPPWLLLVPLSLSSFSPDRVPRSERKRKEQAGARKRRPSTSKPSTFDGPTSSRGRRGEPSASLTRRG